MAPRRKRHLPVRLLATHAADRGPHSARRDAETDDVLDLIAREVFADIASTLPRRQRLELAQIVLGARSALERERRGSRTARMAVVGGMLLACFGVAGGVLVELLTNAMSLGPFACAILLGSTVVGFGLSASRGRQLTGREIAESIRALSLSLHASDVERPEEERPPAAKHDGVRSQPRVAAQARGTERS